MKDSPALATDKTPRYLRLTEEMRQQVRSGVLRPGDSLPSISELRATHGISKSTIERAHLLLEQEGLIVREHGRGTFVTHPQSRRAAQRKGVIGIYGLLESWVPVSSYWTQILEGVREVLQANQTHLMLFDPEAVGVQEKADGALINGEYSHPQPQWRSDRWPCVSLLTPQPADGVSSVAADVGGGAQQAIEYLLDLGHERIAYLHNINYRSQLRLNGYRQALQSANIQPRPDWIRRFKGPETHFYYVGRETMREWLHQGWRDLGCTAIMAQNDAVAAGAIEALTEAGLRVPHDVSIVGFDGSDISDFTRPRLTTVEVPLREIGKRGAELLLDHIENGVDEFQHIILPTRLRVRESAAPPKVRRINKSQQKKEAVS